MPAVVITVAGEDVTDRVMFSTARFSSFVNGKPGEAYMRIRDTDQDYAVDTGADWLVTVDGDAVWRGFVTSVVRVYIAPAMNVTTPGTQRFVDLNGADLNILLARRIVSDHADRANVEGVQFPAGTADTTAITELLDNWLDISGDNLDTTSDVDHVGDLDPEQKTRAWSGSWTWAQAMDSIAMLPAAIYYIRPEAGSPKGTLVYCDVDVPTSPFGLSDQPNGTTTRGYREMEISEDGSSLANDVMAWGMGYGSQTPVFVRDQAPASIAEHGLWQTGKIVPGVYKQGTINRIAESIIDGSPSSKRGSKEDKPSVRLVTYEPGLLAGHVVEFASEVWGWSDTIPIRQLTVTFEAPDYPRYDLLLSHEIDAPWSFIDSFWPQIPGIPQYHYCPDPPCWPGLPGNPVQPTSCETGCLVATCTVDSFDRTVASPDWGGAWSTVSSTAAQDGVTPGIANMADVAGWAVTRQGSTQSEVSTHLLDLSPSCDGAQEPYDYALVWSADAVFPSFSAYDQLGAPPPGSYNFPGAFYLDAGPTLRTVAQEYIEFEFFSDHYPAANGNPTKVRIAMAGGTAYWSLSVTGTATQFQLPTPFVFSTNDRYAIRVTHTIDGARAKMWNIADPEPEEWAYVNGTTGDADDIRPTGFRAQFVRQFPGGTGTTDPAYGFNFPAVRIDLGCCQVFSPGLAYLENWERIVSGSLGSTTPTGYPWTVSGTAVWDVIGGQATASVAASSSSATLNDAGGPWTLPEVTLTLPFKIQNAPTSTSDTSWLSTIFQMAATVQMAITDGPPITGLPKSYIQCAGETTFIPSTFWQDGGVYVLVVEKSGGMRRATVSREGLGTSYSTDWGADASVSSVFGWSPNINSGTQTFTIYPIRFDYEGMPCYYDGSTPVGPTDDAAAQYPNGFGCVQAIRVTSTVYSVPGTFIPNSTFVFRNGQLQARGDDYTENSNNAGVTFAASVRSDEKIQICFLGGVMP